MVSSLVGLLRALVGGIATFLAVFASAGSILRVADISAIDVAEAISNFLNGTGGEWDWDDFTVIPNSTK